VFVVLLSYVMSTYLTSSSAPESLNTGPVSDRKFHESNPKGRYDCDHAHRIPHFRMERIYLVRGHQTELKKENEYTSEQMLSAQMMSTAIESTPRAVENFPSEMGLPSNVLQSTDLQAELEETGSFNSVTVLSSGKSSD
jgi:hypothetical protein